DSTGMPSTASGRMVTLSRDHLQAYDTRTRSSVWTFKGDGTINSDPIIVNDAAYVGTASGLLYAVNLASGRLVWLGGVGRSVPQPRPTDTHHLPTGLGAGAGLVIVPAGNLLVAFRS